ncbi:zinc-binding protein A33-like [Lepisosteus oculatus]|uniref:zinc-binding protein A33-like n=1 Tax=Lepisosteus oculatus TaxID=7918 RepID=UPI003720E52E
MDNIYENVEIKPTLVYSYCSQPTAAVWSQGNSAASQGNSAGKVSFYKKSSVAFACVWIITLIAGLGFIIHRSSMETRRVSELQNDLLDLKMNSSSHITELQNNLETLQREHSDLQRDHSDLQTDYRNVNRSCQLTQSSKAELQKKVEDEEAENSRLQRLYSSMKGSYLPIEMCFPNDTNKTVSRVFAEYSRKEGVVPIPVWKWLHEASADVTLDRNSAHRSLILSPDGKQVKDGDKNQNLPDTPQRFDPVVSVLGRKGFSSGRHYWEVEVGEKTEWTLGIAKESIKRKGKIILDPKNGYWTIWLRNGNEFKALADPSVLLPLSLKPQKVGIYVDYEEGQVSFYNVETRNHIYTFTDTFTEKLYPYFNPSINDDGKNSAPLIISPTEKT